MENTTAQQNAIELAAMRVEVAHLKLAVADLRDTNKQQNEKLDKVLAQLAEARGGWRTLMLIGGAAGTLGSGITWILSHLRT
jgi:phage terminase large subunit-like protein